MSKAFNVVEDNSLQATDTGYQVRVRLDWYRSLPLSCIEKVEVTLDGIPVDPELIRFGINGHEYRLSELPELTSEVWFVLDSATVSVEQPGAIKSGETHTVEAALALRAPYIAIGLDRFLVIASRYATTQVAA